MEDITIDKFKLDEEFVKQPDLMLNYSVRLSGMNKEVSDLKDGIDEAKGDLKTEQANVELEYRFGKISVDIKLTEKAINSLIETDVKIMEMEKSIYDLKKEFNEVVEKRDRLDAMVNALRHRKTSLENLSTLFLSGYYSRPKTEEKNKSERYKQKQKLNKKNKNKETKE